MLLAGIQNNTLNLVIETMVKSKSDSDVYRKMEYGLTQETIRKISGIFAEHANVDEVACMAPGQKAITSLDQT